MMYTAECTAADGGFTRQQSDQLTLLRFSQYQAHCAIDRALQKRYMRPIVVESRKTRTVLACDDRGRSAPNDTNTREVFAFYVS